MLTESEGWAVTAESPSKGEGGKGKEAAERFCVGADALAGPGPWKLSDSAWHSAGRRGRRPPHRTTAADFTASYANTSARRAMPSVIRSSVSLAKVRRIVFAPLPSTK